MMRRAVQVLVAVTIAVGALPMSSPVSEAATPVWPQFVQAHIEVRRADTRVIVDAGHAGVRWVSQPGVRPGDYLFRVDQSGLVRSLDGKLAMTRQGPASGGLTVHVQSPGVDGTDVFVLDPGARPAPLTSETHAGAPGNRVGGVFPPSRPQTGLPLELEINVAGICRPNQYLQVAMEWTNTVWRTPDGTPPGLYQVRVNADLTVQSLDGKTTFTQVPAAPQDHGNQIFGALIVHSCDPQGDGADIIGWDRDPGSGALFKQTSFDQVLDTGYGWQAFNTANTFAPRVALRWQLHRAGRPATAGGRTAEPVAHPPQCGLVPWRQRRRQPGALAGWVGERGGAGARSTSSPTRWRASRSRCARGVRSF